MALWRILVACVVALLLGLSVQGVATAGVSRQDDDTTTTSADAGVDGSGEDNPLLVPGPAAEESTPADEVDADDPTASEEAQVDDDAVDAGSTNDEAEDTVRLVMLALIGIAIALAALTVYYWWRTRPSRRTAQPRSDRPSGRDDSDPSDTPDHADTAAHSDTARATKVSSDSADSVPGSDDAGTVGAWQTDSTSTR